MFSFNFENLWWQILSSCKNIKIIPYLDNGNSQSPIRKNNSEKWIIRKDKNDILFFNNPELSVC